MTGGNPLYYYNPLSVETATLNDDTVFRPTVPHGATAATITSFGGMTLYSVVEDFPPTQQFGRPILNGEEQVIINRAWLRQLQLIRATNNETYITITYYN